MNVKGSPRMDANSKRSFVNLYGFLHISGNEKPSPVNNSGSLRVSVNENMLPVLSMSKVPSGFLSMKNGFLSMCVIPPCLFESKIVRC